MVRSIQTQADNAMKNEDKIAGDSFQPYNRLDNRPYKQAALQAAQ